MRQNTVTLTEMGAVQDDPRFLFYLIHQGLVVALIREGANAAANSTLTS